MPPWGYATHRCQPIATNPTALGLPEQRRAATATTDALARSSQPLGGGTPVAGNPPYADLQTRKGDL